jgi:dynein heavy chain
MYPALVNCTTIDLFNEWPQEALLEVGERYLANVNLEGNEQVKTITNDFKLIKFKIERFKKFISVKMKVLLKRMVYYS